MSPALPRRATLALPALLGLPARAQPAWPERAVTILVPYGPGGTTDIVARLVAEHLREAFGKPFVVENRPGGTTSVATLALARAAPDGHTLMANEITQAALPGLVANLPFDPLRDLQPVSLVAETPVVLAVSRRVAATTLAAFLAQARARPGQLTFGSGGAGSGPHLGMELLRAEAGLDLTHVPYRGAGPALTDLVAGNIDALAAAAPTIAPHAANGTVRALAISGPRRLPSLPEVPTAAEAGFPNWRFAIWFGLTSPRGTPRPVLEALHREVLAMVARPAMAERLGALGAVPGRLGPDEYARFIEAETARWPELIRRAGIRPE